MADVSRDHEGKITLSPDPTVLTTEQLDRAIHSLEQRIEARINAMDCAPADPPWNNGERG
jgi:hypothetical protein